MLLNIKSRDKKNIKFKIWGSNKLFEQQKQNTLFVALVALEAFAVQFPRQELNPGSLQAAGPSQPSHRALLTEMPLKVHCLTWISSLGLFLAPVHCFYTATLKPD